MERAAQLGHETGGVSPFPLSFAADEGYRVGKVNLLHEILLSNLVPFLTQLYPAGISFRMVSYQGRGANLCTVSREVVPGELVWGKLAGRIVQKPCGNGR